MFRAQKYHSVPSVDFSGWRRNDAMSLSEQLSQQKPERVRVSPLVSTAALSIAALVVATGVHFGTLHRPRVVDTASLEPVEARHYFEITDADGNGKPDWQDKLALSGIVVATTTIAATSTDPLSEMADNVARALYGGYLSLKQSDSYTATRGEELGASVASRIQANEIAAPHTVDELSIDEDTSSKRVIRYRSDMRVALAPMVTDDAPEIELFAQYLQTKDSSWLLALADAAARYRAAEKNMLAVTVPKDAVPEHLRALNALESYAETLERMPRFANDAFASVALLKTYNVNEEEMLRSFDALAQYYVRTIAQN